MSGLYDNPQGSSNQMDVMITISDPAVGNVYKRMYEVIAKSNYLIKNIESKAEGDILGLTEERKLEILAEAKISRGLAHFELLRYFGQHYDLNSKYGIAVVLEPLTGSEGPSRNTVQETYNAIIADFDYGIKHAPKAINRQKFTSTTAMAFKSRVALYMQDYETASNLALKLITDADYKLVSDYGDIFKDGFMSEEAIFSPYSWLYDERYYVYGSNRDTPSNRFKAIADKQIGAPDDGDDLSGEGYDSRYAYANALNTLEFGIQNMKWPFNGGAGTQGNSVFVMRFAELYLIYAEAKTRETNRVDADAVAKLNDIRERAGYGSDYFDPQTKAEMLEIVRTEKLLELFGEWSQEWMDMIRYHFLGDIDIKTIRPVVKNDWQLIYPISGTTLAGNKNLEQNPSYPKR